MRDQTPEKTCPHCGARVVTSQDDAGATVLTCTACSATWSSGPRRCRICEGTDFVECGQHLTVTPRGTLRSVIGARTIRLCPRCDAEEIVTASHRGMVVGDTYRSRFLHGDPAPAKPLPQPQHPAPAPAPAPAQIVENTPPAPSVPPAPPREAPAPPPVTDPTVRQAITAFLETSDSADATAMLLLGQHLGAGTRLKAVDVTGSLETWLQRTYSPGSAGHTTIRSALENWEQRGWLPSPSGR